MIPGLFLGLPVALLSYCLARSFTVAGLFIGSLAWLLAVLALLSRRFSLVLASALLLLGEFLALLGPGPPRLWAAGLYGVGLFLFLEIGHDCVGVPHGKIDAASYKLRARFIGSVAAASLVLVHAFGTIAYNLAVHLHRFSFAALALPVLYLVLGGVGFLLARSTRRER
jgi:hypothetical protein